MRSAQDEIACSVHEVVVLFDDLALFVPPIDAELGEPVLQGIENEQPSVAQSFPNGIQASLDRVLGRRKQQP